MTNTDPLAIEYFRTLVADILGNLDSEAFWDEAIEDVTESFPVARFEYFTNEHGVPMRKVVVESAPTVDPNPQVRCGERSCPDYGSADFGEGTCPATHALSAAAATPPTDADRFLSALTAVRAGWNQFDDPSGGRTRVDVPALSVTFDGQGAWQVTDERGLGGRSSRAPSQRMVDAVNRALDRARASGDNPALAVCDAVIALYPGTGAGGLSLGEMPHEAEYCDRNGEPHTGPCRYDPRAIIDRNAARDELVRRMLSVLDGTALTGATEVAEALADSALRAAPGAFRARRDDDVATWIKRRRDENSADTRREDHPSSWYALNGLLDDYRDHADTGTPLTEDVQGPHADTPGMDSPADSPPILPHPYISRGSGGGCLHVVRKPSGPNGTGMGRLCPLREDDPLHVSEKVSVQDPHPFEPVSYKGQPIDSCIRVAELGDGVHRICGEPVDDPVHIQVKPICTEPACPRYGKVATAADCSAKPDRPAHRVTPA